jgi:hypothetical protein
MVLLSHKLQYHGHFPQTIEPSIRDFDIGAFNVADQPQVIFDRSPWVLKPRDI